MFFSRALILVEGPTEENLVPAMFELYHDCRIYEEGVNCIGVGGKNYRPFLTFAFSFDIPVCVISDNDGNTKQEVNATIKRVEEHQGFNLAEKNFSIEFLGEGNDIARELVGIPELRGKIIEALVILETGDNKAHTSAKKKELSELRDEDLLEHLRKKKPSYADFLSEVIIEEPNGKEMIPDAFVRTFEKMDEWMGQ